jgi:hypothetical protein
MSPFNAFREALHHLDEDLDGTLPRTYCTKTEAIRQVLMYTFTSAGHGTTETKAAIDELVRMLVERCENG